MLQIDFVYIYLCSFDFTYKKGNSKIPKGQIENVKSEDRQDHGQHNVTKDKHRTHNTTLKTKPVVTQTLTGYNVTLIFTKSIISVKTLDMTERVKMTNDYLFIAGVPCNVNDMSSLL